MNRIYACIDLKSFYASCECVERNLDPIITNLVVADKERTSKTICLAVSPSLKKYGLKGRARLFEVESVVKKVNEERKIKNNNRAFVSKSYNDNKLKLNPSLELDYIVAKPRMSLYMKYSKEIYKVYLEFLSKEDVYVYSIDEVFCDITDYLKYYKLTPEELVTKMILKIFENTGITATGGIGTNLYLAKVAMDIMAKHVKANNDGVRIAYLDELSYRKNLWNHVPLTDFWRIGRGYEKSLNDNKMYTMGDICRKAIGNEDELFKLFGVNAELLIDHAFGYEPVTIKDIKKYKPMSNCLSSGQVLHEPYDYLKTKIIVGEMAYDLVLNMVSKDYLTDMIILTINYDSDNLKNGYNGAIKKDFYGRNTPKEAHGTIRIDHFTSSTKIIMKKTMELFNKITDSNLLVRRINLTFGNLIYHDDLKNIDNHQQLDLFSSYNQINDENDGEKNMQKTVLKIKKKYGKNAILRGVDLMEGATAMERNKEIGGHKA